MCWALFSRLLIQLFNTDSKLVPHRTNEWALSLFKISSYSASNSYRKPNDKWRALIIDRNLLKKAYLRFRTLQKGENSRSPDFRTQGPRPVSPQIVEIWEAPKAIKISSYEFICYRCFSELRGGGSCNRVYRDPSILLVRGYFTIGLYLTLNGN